ncbi:ABC transporter permease [Clostridium sp. SYSU_GA19001]|uniref:ABC transporter permease n=1 Tax=Clostridium caldaquaticum TaxID=2940653 RepID=UPI002076FF81|nr:ABC transporter permease [Clostridium caldaquaticum]MCM8711821.1 ABC transporter permease [Clostridium caldaquaticum]
MWPILITVVPLAVAYIAPLLIIALGGLFSERSGVVNIGLEGLLGVGAFAGAIVTLKLQDSLGGGTVYVSLIAAALAGGIFSLLHAFASITMRADQVVSGTAINILSAALTIFLARSLNEGRAIIKVIGLDKADIPFFSDIPVIGPLFFKDVYYTTFIVLAIVAVSWYVLYYRPFGLRLRACGENPHAADSLGINVLKIRYIGVVLSGMLAGLGGGILLNTVYKEFSDLTFTGLGFLALAALIFGKWRPWSVAAATIFFGFAKTVAEMSVLFPAIKNMPNIVFNTFPYVATLVALVLFSKNAAGPRAAGEPYDPGKR